jgi:hypothetical protein
MRYAVSLALFFASLSSMAWVDLQLVSGEYRIEARLTGDAGQIMAGSVVAKSQTNGECRGRYALDPMEGMISIDLDGNRGPGVGGGCANESMVVNMGPNGFAMLMEGAEIDAMMRSVMFFDMPRQTMIKLTGMGDN